MNTKPHTIKRSFSSIHLLSRLCFGLIGLIGLGFGFGFGFASPMLSAATLDDLQFTLINGGTEYAVSAVNPSTISGAVDIPATFNGLPVTQVKDSAFASASLITSVTIPASIKVIQTKAFYKCRTLSTVTFAPNSQLTLIDSNAFHQCFKLQAINLPDSLAQLNSSVFENCSSLTSIVLPDSITYIGHFAFGSCSSLTSIVLPESITEIQGQTFYNCNSLTSIVLPKSITSIQAEAFKYCYDLASITFLGSAPTLGDNVFLDTGSNVGGFTITVYDTHETSYDSWRTSYTVDVIPDPTAPVVLTALIGYNPSSGVLSVISEDEPSSVTVDLQHTDALEAAWTTLSTSDYEAVTDSNTNSVTRNLIIDPETSPTGFYRLSAEQ
ncbi:MAG: leucine-rich repeat domain-containing protein [Verrucomicrobia bacterium]|nr:leucine-rich repeat domain-containing protein [Verrucomicrobiota bacterium]